MYIRCETVVIPTPSAFISQRGGGLEANKQSYYNNRALVEALFSAVFIIGFKETKIW
jgi:hypothetical protein